MSTQTYTQDDADKIPDLLIGRRIVAAEMGDFDYPGRKSYGAKAEGRLTLDDGTVLYLTGNDGGCACSAGCYPLEKVAAVDNIITSARVECSPSDDYSDDSGDGAYRIFVFADATEINVAEFVGTDGNGYYGTGFALTVVRPEAHFVTNRSTDPTDTALIVAAVNAIPQLVAAIRGVLALADHIEAQRGEGVELWISDVPDALRTEVAAALTDGTPR